MLIGHLGRTPEMRYTPNGKPVTSFSIITTHAWTASDGKRHQETDWFNIVAWGDLAEECKRSLNKGQHVYIEGHIRTRRWNDESNMAHSCAEMIVQDVIPLS